MRTEAYLAWWSCWAAGALTRRSVGANEHKGGDEGSQEGEDAAWRACREKWLSAMPT